MFYQASQSLNCKENDLQHLPKVEIDFFFAKGLPVSQFQDTVISEKVASDHRPIAVVITANAERNAKPESALPLDHGHQ